jgi:endonuclease G
MKKILLITIPSIFSIWSYGQIKADTVIKTPIYTSYFNYSLHEPLYVVYSLYKGGGNCSRAGDAFVTDNLPNSATSDDYYHSGYDEGHEANSKDFAFNCALQKMTFRFYNCVPQTPRLNRGVWKHLETLVRKESQTDSLLIICGNIFGDKKIGDNKIAVPDYCYKIVFSLSSHKMIHCRLFPNDNSDSYKDVDLSYIESRVNYKLVY